MEMRLESRRARLVSSDPLTGSEIGEVPVMGHAEVSAMVGASRTAMRAWSARALPVRARALERLRHIIASRADEIAALVRSETGKTLAEALVEITIACDYVAYLARVAPNALIERRAATGLLAHRKAWVAYQPFGVIAAITPWNYPFVLSLSAAATSLVAGNGVVLKPSEYTPLTGVLVGELLAEATGLQDLVGVATGDGSTGAALIATDVDKIAFTGSVATGKKVMRAAAESLTPLVLELGGKDAMIVCADADIERAARGAVWSAFYACGQLCQSVERVYVVDPVYDEFVQIALAEARRVRTSDEPEATIGSLIAPFQVEKVQRHLQDAQAKGARVLLGGRAINAPGFFFEPTVIVDVSHDMELMREETFGPVLPIMRVADEEEALRLAADSDYGLNASVWTRDRAKARRIARQLEVGSVVINDHMINYAMADLPFGGARDSGFGRVHGLEGLREFVRPTAWVEDRIALKHEPHWFQNGGRDTGMARAILHLKHGRGPVKRLRAAFSLLVDYLR